MCDEKWIHMTTRQLPAQWLDWEEAPKYFPKPNLHQKEDHGHCLVVWSTTTLWILVKPLYLRSMLSKWMRHTQNCHACSQHWSTEGAQLFSMGMPDRTPYSQGFKTERTAPQVLPQPYLRDLLPTNHHFLKHLNKFLQGKCSITSRRQKTLSKSSSTPNTWSFMLQE